MLTRDLSVAGIAFKRIFTPPLAGLINILVIGIALSLPAGMYVLLQNAQSLVAQFSDTPQISLFLSMNATLEDVSKIRRQLNQHAGIKKITFISRTEALATRERPS